MFTDKLVAKIPSTCDGVVKALQCDIEDVCLVGHSLLLIEVDGDSATGAEIPSQHTPEAAAETPVEQATQIASKTVQSGPGK